MTQQSTSHPNSSEYSPEQRRVDELSDEALAARSELHNAWNDILYGNLESSDGDIAVRDLGQRIDPQSVAFGVDGGKYLDDLEKNTEIDEAGLEADVRMVQSGANTELAQVGMANSEKDAVTHRDAANETVAEVLTDGQGEAGRLNLEDQRSARDAAIATELDKAIRRGDTEALQHLPPSVAAKTAAWLGNIGQRYGGAEFAPNSEIAMVGAYVAFAEKVADATKSETVAHVDPSTGEATAESMDDVIVRILDGDPGAAKLISPAHYDDLMEKKRMFEHENGRFFSSKIDWEDQQILIEQARQALLSANAERMAA